LTLETKTTQLQSDYTELELLNAKLKANRTRSDRPRNRNAIPSPSALNCTDPSMSDVAGGVNEFG
jgi:hypothetical protein